MENFLNLPNVVWFVITISILVLAIALLITAWRNNLKMVFRLKILGKNLIFFPKEIKGSINYGILRRYASQYTKGLSRELLNYTITAFNADAGVKSRLNRYVLNYKFGDRGLEYDFLLTLSLMQIRYLTMGVGVNEDTIDSWLKRLNTLISNRYITKAISQEARNILIAELIKRFMDKAFPEFRFKNVFYNDFVRDVHLVQKIEPILEQALDDIEIENMLFKMEIKATTLFTTPSARYRLWIYQHAVLCRNWIK